MDPSTRFDDEAIRRILHRAAERQEQAEKALPAADRESHTGPQPGLSLAELQEVADEVGIAPAHVAAAAREVQLQAVDGDDRFRFLGIPKETVLRRVVPGVPDDRAWERIVGEVRSEFRVPGVTNSFGSVREWWSSGTTSSGVARLRVEPGEAGTEVVVRRSNRAMSELTHALGWTFAGMGGAFGLAVVTGVLPDALPAPIIFGSLSLLTFVAGRLLSRLTVRRNDERFTRLLDRIELVSRQGSAEE